MHTDQQVAVKCILQEQLSETMEANILNEVGILKSLDHPHIVHFIELYEDKSHIYICMEYVPGGELFERIVLRSAYTEEVARKCIQKICLAVQYLHELNIVHR